VSFAWPLDRPLPPGWAVGTRVHTPDGWVVRAEAYPDPYYGGKRMYQIRSDQSWARGFFRLDGESSVRVGYRVRERQRGQVCFCVRSPNPGSPDTGMLEWNGDFVPPAPGEQWQTLDVRAGDLTRPPNHHAPRFGPPWVGFLVIFNTFEENVGLTVSEFQVSGPPPV